MLFGVQISGLLPSVSYYQSPMILSSQWDIFFQEVHLLQFFNSARNLFAWIPFSPCIAAKNTQKKVYRFSLSLGSVCRILPTLVFLIRALQQKIILARSLGQQLQRRRLFINTSHTSMKEKTIEAKRCEVGFGAEALLSAGKVLLLHPVQPPCNLASYITSLV